MRCRSVKMIKFSMPTVRQEWGSLIEARKLNLKLKLHGFKLFCSSVVTGILQTKVTVDDTYMISFEAFNLSGGQYKKIFGRVLGNFCEVLWASATESTVKKFFASSNFTPPSIHFGMCPLPSLVVQVNDWAPGELLEEFLRNFDVKFYFQIQSEIICRLMFLVIFFLLKFLDFCNWKNDF